MKDSFISGISFPAPDVMIICRLHAAQRRHMSDMASQFTVRQLPQADQGRIEDFNLVGVGMGRGSNSLFQIWKNVVGDCISNDCSVYDTTYVLQTRYGFFY